MRPLAAKGQWHYPVITCYYAFVSISEKDTNYTTDLPDWAGM